MHNYWFNIIQYPQYNILTSECINIMVMRVHTHVIDLRREVGGVNNGNYHTDKKLYTGNINYHRFVKFPSPAQIPVKSGNYPGDPNLGIEVVFRQ